MDSIKDILSQLKKTIPKEKKKKGEKEIQSKLFDLDTLETNPKRIFGEKGKYISTEYQGDFHGDSPTHFISRIYALDNDGKFKLVKDPTGKAYYYEIITSTDDESKEFEFKRNWF